MRGEAPAAWRALFALGALFFLVTAGTFSSLGVVLPDMVAALKWDWTGAGLGFTLLGLSTGLASYAPTLVTRRAGVRLTLLLGGAISAAGFGCLHLAQGLPLYWIGATLAGLGFALCAIIPGTFVLARAFRARSLAFGLYFTIGGLGGVAGPWLYLAVKGLTGDWRAYWLYLAVAAVVLGAVAAVIAGRAAEAPAANSAPPTTAETDVAAEPAWSVAAAVRTPQFWTIVAAYTAYLLCEVTVNTVSVQHLTERGAPFALASGLLSFQALVSVVARAAGGFAGETIDPRRLVIAGLACMAVGLAGLALARDLPLMLVYAVGVGLGYGLNYLATAVLLLRYFGRSRNLELFSLMCLVSTLASTGPFIGGLVHDRTGGFGPALWGFAAVAAVVLAAVLLMRPPQEPERARGANPMRVRP